MRLFLPKCLGITILCCLYSIFTSAQSTPGVTNGNVLWLDASDVNAGGAAPAVGSAVTTWKDKSGTNHDATSTGSNTAVYTTGGPNTTKVIRFNRTSAAAGSGFTVNGLDIRAVTSPEVTIFAVYKQGTNDGNNQSLWGNDNNSPQRYFNSKWSTGATDGSVSTGGAASVIPNAAAVGETKLVTAVYSGLVNAGVNNGASNASAVYINGKKISNFTDLTAASSGQSVFKIGSDGDNNYFNGDVSEILVYNRKLTDCELETVNRYLSNKYQLDFVNIGANYTLGVPVNYDIAGIGRPVSVCGGNYNVMTSTSDIVMITNPSSTTTAGVVLTFANDRKGYDASSETPPAFTSRLTQKWRADLNGNIGTVDICFNLENLGIDVSNSGNFALLIDKDGNFSDATVISAGVTVFVDRVCISNVPITKGDYFTLATRAATSSESSITSPNLGKFQKAAFATATVVDPDILVKGSQSITDGRAYIDSGFVSGDVLAWSAGTLPSGVTATYNATTGAISFKGTATAAQWQVIFRNVTFRTTSSNNADRLVKFSLGNVVSYTVGSKPHYYEYVTTTMNWVNAKAAAEARTLYGLKGYLATITSQIENDFITAKLSADGWVGASCNYQQVNTAVGSTVFNNQTSADGKYYWITGPEAGQAISTGLTTPVAVGGAFANWNGGEPNNYNGTNEQFVQLYSTNAGRWNDLPLTSLLGYVVEYGGYATDGVLNIDYKRIVRSSPAAPVITSIDFDSGSSATDKITNDSTLVFSGTSPIAAKVTLIREDLGVLGTVTADSTGKWSFDYSGTKLVDGTYNFTAVDTVASVESAMSVVFQVTIDRTAPSKPGTPALQNGTAYSNVRRSPMTGSAEPGSTVTIYVDGVSNGTTKADSTGTWKYTPPANLALGVRSIKVTSTDLAGNISIQSDAFSFTIDVTAPATPPKPTLVGGTGGVISNSKPTITGTAEANSTVIIFKDGVAIDSVMASSTGAYTYTFVTALPDATYNITVKAKDAATNLSAASPALSITVDTTPPATPPAPTVVGSTTGYTNNNKPTITGTAEANSTVIIFRNGTRIDSVTASATGVYNYTFPTALPDATYSITVRAKDVVANVSNASPALSMIVDTSVPVTPPAPTLVGGINGWINTDKPTIQGTAEANTTIIIYKDGVKLDSVPVAADGKYTYTFVTALPDATYSITVRDKDNADNISGLSSALSIKVDTSVPATPAAPALVGGNNGSTNDNTPDIQGVAEANSTVTIYVDGSAVGTTTANGVGNYTYTLPLLADGAHTVKVTATDAAGNTSPQSPALNIMVDTVTPNTPAAPVLVSGANDNTPDIKGKAEANSTVTIYVDGVAVGTTPADASGDYTYTLPTQTDGAHAVKVTATDAAGNTSAQSPALNITIDTTAPNTPPAPVLVSGANDNTPDIKGKAEANSTVTIYVDGVAVGTTPADASGDYTYTLPTQADGAHAVKVTATDAAGNTSAQSPALNINIDTVVPNTPTAPVLLSGANDNTPDIKGKAEANSTVTIYVDGIAVGTTPADASGDYTYTLPAQTDGAHAVTVTATDAAGNTSAQSPALNITIDTTAPTTPTAPTLVGGNNGVINDNTPDIKGITEANSTVTIYVDGVAVGTTPADASGNYSYTLPTQTDGAHAVKVTATDASGNTSALSPALNITVDTAAPNTPTAPVLVSGANDNTPDIKGKAEANSTVTIYVDGVAVGTTTADASGNYTYTLPTQTDGAHSVTVTATDAAGNTSAQSPALNITVDTAAPTTPAAPVLVSGMNDNTPDIKGKAEANSTVTIYVDGVAVGTTPADASGDYTYTLPTQTDGAHAVKVTATDAAGNTSAQSPALNIIIDTTAPNTPAAPVLVSAANDNTPDIKGKAEANSTVTIYVDGTAVGTTTVDASGDYTYTLPTQTDGAHAVKVTATDAAGNTSAQSPALNITIDTAAPNTPTAPVLVSGANDNTPDIKGKAEANSTVTIYVDGVAVGTTTADASGDYTYTLPTQTDGTHSVTVTATDAAGNTSGQSPALNITVDTAAPATPAAPVLVSGANDNTPDIKGKAEANSTVTIYVDGTAVGTTTADASGDYTYTLPTQTDGAHAVKVTATDAAGNTSAQSPALDIIIDTAAPATPAAPVLMSGANDNTPDIKGKAEANSTVTIYVDGVAVGTTPADANGDYTYTLPTQTDGAHAVKVTATDAAGNTSAQSPALNIIIDTTAPNTPAAPVLVSGANDNTPDIKGKAEANSTVTIYVDGTAVGTTTANASGDYTYTLPAQTDGAHAVKVTATDAAGNTSAQSPALNINVDATAPATPPAPIMVSGSNNITKDPTPDIKGTAEANSTVTIYLDGLAIATTTANASGNYTYTFTNDLSEGAHAIKVTATDAAGNTSAQSPALNITVDTAPPSPPAAPILVGGNNNIINDATPDIKGTAESNSTVTIYVDGVAAGTATADAGGNYTYTLPAQTDGAHAIRVTATDIAGNTSSQSPALNIIIDTKAPATPPAPTLTDGNNGVTKNNKPTIVGTAEANSTVTIYLDGSAVATTTADAGGNYTYTFPMAWPDGAHTVKVTATDAAGNTSPQSPALNITVDATAPATPPAPELVDGSNGVTTDETPMIKGKAEANSTVTIYLGSTAAGVATADANGDYTYTFSELPDSKYTISVTATDAAGNTSGFSPVLDITVDAHAPLRPTAPVLVGGVNNATKDPTPDIKGKTEAAALVTIYSDGVKVGTATADASGNYTYTFDADLTDGTHNIAVTATDTAGNVSPMSPDLIITVDTHAPGTPTAPVLVDGTDGLINTGTPTITGKAEPNSTVTISVDGNVAGTAPVDADGNYTFTFPNTLPDGPHAVTVTATDAVGNTSENSSPALNIIIDTVPPDAPSTPVLVTDLINGIVQTDKPTVKGTAEANSIITVYDGDVAAGTTKANGDGNWTYTFEHSIPNGSHTVTATATDVAGNTSTKSGELVFMVDAFVPAIPLPPRLPGVNGSVGTQTPSIAGQGEPGTLITIYTDGQKSGTAIVDANGNWTYTYNPPLLESVHNINVTASKLDGSTESGHSETVKLTIDLVGPTVKLSVNAPGGVVLNGTVMVTVTFSEGVSGFSWTNLKVTNAKVSGFLQVSGGIYQVMITPTENGVVTVMVPENSGFDVIGNGNLVSETLSMDMKSTVGIGQVYPMPATDVVNVRMDGIKDADARVSMTNMAGQVLQNQAVYVRNGVLLFNVSRLPSGSYVLRVMIKNETYNTTVVIAR